MENQKPMVATTIDNPNLNKLSKGDDSLRNRLQHKIHLTLGECSEPFVKLYQVGDGDFLVKVSNDRNIYSFVFTIDHNDCGTYIVRSMACRYAFEQETCEVIFQAIKDFCEFDEYQ